MGETNSERFLCPICLSKDREQEMGAVSWGYQCGKCGYEIHYIPGRKFAKWANINQDSWISIVRVMVSLLLAIAGILLRVIYLVPAIVYSVILLAICVHALGDIYSHMVPLYTIESSEVEAGVELLSRMVLYIILLLALMDLTSIISERFLYPIYPELTRSKKSDTKKEDTRAYLTTVVVISVIFILMHAFHKLFDPDSGVDGTLIFACLIGSAAVLIAVGLWKKLDSESD